MICLGWLALTVGCHLSERLAQFVAGFDLFSVVPSWSFFAPIPVTTDPHLIYRDRTDDGSVGPFCEVACSNPIRGHFAFFWNPRRRVSKVFTDTMSDLIALSGSLKPHDFKLSIPYLTLANFVQNIESESSSVARQFAIVSTAGFDEQQPPDLIFVLEFHPLSIVSDNARTP